MAAQESNRFFNLNGDLIRSRRGRGEALEPSEWTEFEVDCPGASTVRLEHRYGCPVRFWVTDWVPDGVAAAPILGRSATSTDKVLVLDSGKAGRAVIRVEKSQFQLSGA